MSRQKIGALIIMERETKIGDIINTGTIIDGEVSRQLLINIFIPNTHLNDGAVVIRDNQISLCKFRLMVRMEAVNSAILNSDFLNLLYVFLCWCSIF